MIINKDDGGRTLYYVTVNLILQKGNKVLLQRRANTGWGDGKWSCVGGHIENGETLKECIIREAKEEIGITLNKRDVEVVHCTQFRSNRFTIQFFLKCSKWKGEPTIQPELENGKNVYKADKLEWFDVNNLPIDLMHFARVAINSSFSNQPFSIVGFDKN